MILPTVAAVETIVPGLVCFLSVYLSGLRTVEHHYQPYTSPEPILNRTFPTGREDNFYGMAVSALIGFKTDRKSCVAIGLAGTRDIPIRIIN